MGFVHSGRSNIGRFVGRKKRDKKLDRAERRSTLSLTPPAEARHSHHNTPKRRRLGSDTPICSSHIKLSSFERLPTEILQKIFLDALNPALAEASLTLARVLTGRHLQRQYLRVHRKSPMDLSKIFGYKFFTDSFLTDYENHFSERLDATGAFIPSSIAAQPTDKATGDNSQLLCSKMIERGARWDQDESDRVLEHVYQALMKGRKDVVFAVFEDDSLLANSECLKLALQYSGNAEIYQGVDYSNGDLRLYDLLVGKGARTDSLDVWNAALEIPEEKARQQALDWLLKKAAPPSDVLGRFSL